MKKLLLALFLLLPGLALAAPTCTVGAANTAPKAVLAWVAPTLNTDTTAITNLPLTYNLYQGTSSGTEVKVASGITALTSTLTTGLVGGKSYYWFVTAVDSQGTEGLASAEVCKTFPGSVPAAVTLTVS